MKVIKMKIRLVSVAVIYITVLITVVTKIYCGESEKIQSESIEGKMSNNRDRAWKTPLIVSESKLAEAAFLGDSEKMRVFIAAGADINRPVSIPPRAKTVLMIAAEQGHNHIVEMLLEAGVDIEAKDDVWFPGHYMDVDGDTAFMYAVSGGHYDTVKLFIQWGVDVNKKNRTTKTPLNYASSRGYNDIAELLIESGADVNIQTRFPPLSMAVRQNHIDVVKTLIAAGADVNIGSGEALRTACFYGNQEIVEILLQAGADVNIRSTTIVKGEERVETALGIAKKRGHDDIASLLKAAGAVE